MGIDVIESEQKRRVKIMIKILQKYLTKMQKAYEKKIVSSGKATTFDHFIFLIYLNFNLQHNFNLIIV